MKRHSKGTRQAAALLTSLCAVLTFLLLVPEDVFGRHTGSIRSGRFGRGRYNYAPDHNLRRMQQERIEADEEARREPSREKRRKEIDQERSAEVEAYLESQESIRSSSQAAINAPRGFYFRKPGSITTQPPVGAVEIAIGSKTYHYFSGIFYLSSGSRYIVVTAPAGAAVDALPDGHGVTEYGDRTYYYYFGTFFVEKGEKFEIVTPPRGVVVGYLPDGYNEVRDQGEDLVTYEYGGVLYEPVFLDGLLAYMVISG